MPAAVVVASYRTTQGAVNSEELHCIVRTLGTVTVTPDSVPKGRKLRCIANSNSAVIRVMVNFRYCPECLLQSVCPECLLQSVCPECLL